MRVDKEKIVQKCFQASSWYVFGPSSFTGCLVQDLHRIVMSGSRILEIKMFGNIVSLCFGCNLYEVWI